MKKYFIILPLIALLFLSLYYPNRDYSYDSIEYAIEAQNHNLSFHPHHLLFYPTIKAFDLFFTSLNMQKMLNIMPIQFMNIIIFPFTVLLLYLIILNITKHQGLAVITSLIYGFSGGAWTLSVDNEVYTLSLLFLLLVIYLLISESNILLIAIVFSLSILYHQSYVLAFPAFAYLIYSLSEQKKMLRVFLFLFSSASVVTGFYLAAANIEGKGSAGEIIKWILFYTESGKWGSVSFYNFFYSGAGFFQLFFAPKLIRLIAFGKKVHGIEYLYLCLEIIGALLIAVIFFILLKRSLKSNLLNNIFVKFDIVFIITFSAFAFFWEPQNVEFWIPVFIPLLLLFPISVISAGNGYKRNTLTEKVNGIEKISVLCAVFFIAMFIHNLFSAVIPASNMRNNYSYLFAEKISPYISDGDLLIDNKKRSLSYLKYFFGKQPDYTSFSEFPLSKWNETDEIKKKLSEEIDNHLASKRRVLITSTEINPPEYDPALKGVLNGNERSYFYQRYSSMIKKSLFYEYYGSGEIFILEE